LEALPLAKPLHSKPVFGLAQEAVPHPESRVIRLLRQSFLP
jgi:hypothetical protein